MIRLVVRIDDCLNAAHVGGPIVHSYRTVDIDHPELEAYLREKAEYETRTVVGAEVLPANAMEES